LAVVTHCQKAPRESFEACYHHVKREGVYIMQLKHTVLALAVAGMISGQAYAAEAQVEAVGARPVADFSQTDLQALFEQDAKPMQLAALSEQEMKETEGAWLLNAAGAFVGGFSGAYGYLTSVAYNPNADPRSVAWGLTKSIALGAAWGAIRPAQSIGGALGRLSFSAARGAVIGYGSGRGWW
jgi:hypothetical protein